MNPLTGETAANKWSNVQDGINSRKVASTGDYLIQHEGEWYFWIDGTSPYDNHGPYATDAAALDAYNRVSETQYSLNDLEEFF